MATHFCLNIYGEYPVGGYGAGETGVFTMTNGVMFLVTTFVIIFFIKRQEKLALEGDHLAVESVIFPIFVKVLWLNAFVNFTIGAVMVLGFSPFLGAGPKDDGSNIFVLSAVLYSCLWGLQHAMIEGVAILLTQKGLGYHAAKRAGMLAAAWGIFTTLIILGFFTIFGEALAYTFLYIWEFMVFVLYAALWKVPLKYFYRRPAVLQYARFWTWFRLFIWVCDVFSFFDSTKAVGACSIAIGNFFIFPIFQPYIAYYSFVLDSRWWQGLAIPKHSVTRLISQDGGSIKSPLAGMVVDLHSAQSLADALDHMKGDQGVQMLNFAYIKLYSNSLLGQGSFSKVYRGSYQAVPCAIKLIYTLDLTVEVIGRVAAEAEILSSVQHPNIIKIFGVAVLPPSVCILLEICALGSLADVLRGRHRDGQDDGRGSFVLRRRTAGKENLGDLARLRLCFADLIHLCLGCARGLARLHDINADMCHRDVKSMNFLVDEQLVAKVADLELGVIKDQAATDDEEDEFLPNWAAPEVVVVGGKHTQASDVYSFALVMWEMISRKIPFAEIRNSEDIRSKILAGERPSLNIPMPSDVQPAFILLLQSAWSPEPADRPTMHDIVNKLQDMKMAVCSQKVECVKVHPNMSALPRGSIDFDKCSLPFCSTNVLPALPLDLIDLFSTFTADIQWSGLETAYLSGSSWAVFSAMSPHWLLRPSASWTTDFELSAAEVFHAGGFAGLALYPNDHKMMIRRKLRDFLRCFSTGKCGHVVLELRRRDHSTGFYSIHCFPVLAKTTDGGVGVLAAGDMPEVAAVDLCDEYSVSFSRSSTSTMASLPRREGSAARGPDLTVPASPTPSPASSFKSGQNSSWLGKVNRFVRGSGISASESVESEVFPFEQCEDPRPNAQVQHVAVLFTYLNDDSITTAPNKMPSGLWNSFKSSRSDRDKSMDSNTNSSPLEDRLSCTTGFSLLDRDRVRSLDIELSNEHPL